MTTLQKTFIGAALATAVGTGVFEAHQFEKRTGQKPGGSEDTEPIITIETHENISVNEELTKEEFTHDPIAAPVTDVK